MGCEIKEMKGISQEILNELFVFNPEVGVLVNKIDRGRTGRAGAEIRSTNKNGYIQVRINNNTYLAHRIIWLLVYGELPKEIDHINGNVADNRLSNLRSVSHIENMKNQQIYKNNKSGTHGVHWCKRDKKWIARITVNKKRKIIGYFETIKEASLARKVYESRCNFHENHGMR